MASFQSFLDAYSAKVIASARAKHPKSWAATARELGLSGAHQARKLHWAAHCHWHKAGEPYGVDRDWAEERRDTWDRAVIELGPTATLDEIDARRNELSWEIDALEYWADEDGLNRWLRDLV